MSTQKTILSVMAIAIVALSTLTLYAAGGQSGQDDDISLEATPNRYPPYALGDTIVVGVKAAIPKGYHLYSNPLGPGIGKPLNLFVNRRDDDHANGRRAVPWSVDWFEARKSFPTRYNPPIGSWVWAYESEAYFFVKGVMVKDSSAAVVDTVNTGGVNNVGTNNVNTAKTKPSTVKDKDGAKHKDKGKKGTAEAAKPVPPTPPSVLTYEIVVEALICKSACIPILKSVSFELPAPDASAWSLSGVEMPLGNHASEKVAERSRGDLTTDNVNTNINTNTNTDINTIAAGTTAPGITFPSVPALQSHYAKSETIAFSVGLPSSMASALGGIGGINMGINTGINNSININGGINTGVNGGTNTDSLGLSSQYLNDTNRLNDSADGRDGRDKSRPYDYIPLEERHEYSLITAILFALLAGLALNLTPCIFPMLSVRILSFAESANESRRSAVVRSSVFSLGIVAVFLLLAGLAAFAGFSWGQQFQNPGTMVGIIAIVFLFALGMFNFYTLNVPAIGGGNVNNNKKRSAFLGDFLKGAAATVMATPCGGPFLGALLAWALLQKPLTIFVLFATMGVGMALPYVLLASSKRLMSLLPKPGQWIEDLKHFMGFLLLAFAVNMMRSLDPRLTTTAVGICLSILIAASVNKRFAQFGMPAARRAAVALISLAILAAGITISVIYLRIDVQIFNDDDRPIAGGPYWSSFSKQALTTAQDEKRNVIVNFTASWCTNCKLNKATTLNTTAARQLYGDKNILLLTADITNDNPEAQELMRHLGSRSVPFLAIFPADAPKNPIIMRDILSKDKFLGELRNLP